MPDRTLTVAISQAGPIPLDVDFSCAPGDVLAIFGPSGSGKTTILRTIAGLYSPARASVRSGTEVWADSAVGTFVPAHRRAVGFVFQDYALFPHLTAVGNVMAAMSHRPRSERRERAEKWLSKVNLGNYGNRLPKSLSGGERQRVAIARALARDPALLLLDEPFAAVDRSVRRRLQQEISLLRREIDIPLVLVTHDFDDVVRLSSHVLLLEHGRTMAAGPLSTLMSRPDLAWLRDAVGFSSVFEASVRSVDTGRGLVELAFDGGHLVASARALDVGERVRVRIPAREVILAVERPTGLSVHNSVSGVVKRVHSDPAFDHPIVQIEIGRTLLLAEVTHDAVAKLEIVAGRVLHALIKSVSIQIASN